MTTSKVLIIYCLALSLVKLASSSPINASNIHTANPLVGSGFLQLPLTKVDGIMSTRKRQVDITVANPSNGYIYLVTGESNWLMIRKNGRPDTVKSVLELLRNKSPCNLIQERQRYGWILLVQVLHSRPFARASPSIFQPIHLAHIKVSKPLRTHIIILETHSLGTLLVAIITRTISTWEASSNFHSE